MREIAAIFTSKKSKRTVTHWSGSPFCVQQMQQRSERQIDFFLCAVLQGFQHGIFVEELLSGQVGDGAGHPEDAVMGAGREAQRVVRSAEELLGTGVIRQIRRTCPAVSWALQRTPSKPGAA